MAYYTTQRGAKVFAAGTINFGGSALWPTTSKLLDNLWNELEQMTRNEKANYDVFVMRC